MKRKKKLKVMLTKHNMQNQYLLYHNPRCSKSRACLEIIKSKKLKFSEINYLKEGLDCKVIHNIIDKLFNPLSDLVRTNEKIFKNNAFDICNTTLLVGFLNKFPICLQRPLFFNGSFYIICRPPEKIHDFI